MSAPAPLCCKNMCCASRFCTGGGGAAGSNVQGPVKQNASPGEQSEAPRPRWKPGQEQNPGPENQDSQHMLEQPRGSFPDFDPCRRATMSQHKSVELIPEPGQRGRSLVKKLCPPKHKQSLLFPRGCELRGNSSRSAPKRIWLQWKRHQSAREARFSGPRLSLKIWGLSPRL